MLNKVRRATENGALRAAEGSDLKIKHWNLFVKLTEDLFVDFSEANNCFCVSFQPMAAPGMNGKITMNFTNVHNITSK